MNSLKRKIYIFYIYREKDMMEFKAKICDISKENDLRVQMNQNNIGSQIEQIEIFKRDIHSMIYDNNLSVNNRFQLINESLIEKFEDYDKIIGKFQDNILLENTKFTEYISEQVEKQQGNSKKLIDYLNSDVCLLKEKVISYLILK